MPGDPANLDPPLVMVENLVRSLPEVLGTARGVRVWEQRPSVRRARKHPDRAPSPLLVDLTQEEATTSLAAALRLRPDTEIMDWMEWPRLWCEFIDEQGGSLITLGLLLPDWVRWDPHGDLQLAYPEPLRAWLLAWT